MADESIAALFEQGKVQNVTKGAVRVTRDRIKIEQAAEPKEITLGELKAEASELMIQIMKSQYRFVLENGSKKQKKLLPFKIMLEALRRLSQ